MVSIDLEARLIVKLLLMLLVVFFHLQAVSLLNLALVKSSLAVWNAGGTPHRTSTCTQLVSAHSFMEDATW